jgi:hypothetical protein
MKFRTVVWITCATITSAALTGAQAASVKSDYDSSADFSKFRTWSWLQQPGGTQPPLAQENPLTHKRILSAVEQELAAKGLERLDEGTPSLLLSYHVGLKERVDVDTFGYRGRWGPGEVQVRTYTEGTLVLDMVDAEKKELVWRGWVTALVQPGGVSEETIRKSIRKLLKKFPPEAR